MKEIAISGYSKIHDYRVFVIFLEINQFDIICHENIREYKYI